MLHFLGVDRWKSEVDVVALIQNSAIGDCRSSADSGVNRERPIDNHQRSEDRSSAVKDRDQAERQGGC
jgi:hypothetical protein